MAPIAKKQSQRRIAKACRLCNKRKVKCDGAKQCANCTRYNQVCVYSTHKITNNTTTQNGDDDIKDVISPFFTFSCDKYRFHTRYQNILPNYLGQSLVNQLSNHTLLQGIETPRIQNYSWNLAGGHFLSFHHLPSHNNSSTPPWDFTNPTHINLAKKIVSWYFKHCNPIFSIVHEQKFCDQFNNRFLKHISKPYQTANKLFQSILYLIIIISIRFNDGLIFKTTQHNGNSNSTLFNQWEFNFLHNNASHLEQSLFNYSYTFIAKLTFEWESFELIQSWLLITFYLRTCYRQTATWNALSRAISLVKGMSLHLNMFPIKHQQYDETKALHCFWACFIMDKIISFQIGRQCQLETPLNDMPTPRTLPLSSDSDDWPFHSQTQQMFDLSIIIYDFHQNKCFEMDLDSSFQFRHTLQSWFDSNQVAANDDNELFTMELQPLMTYLDIRFNFELRSFFPLLDPPPSSSSSAQNNSKRYLPSLPLDMPNLLAHCQLTIKIIARLSNDKLIFIPWWSTLSNLFSVTLISLTCSYLNLQTLSYRQLLTQIMPIWDQILTSDPWNPPIMAKQCNWCIKTLNHMISLVLQDTSSNLKSIIGIDHGDNTPNQNKFKQFSRVGDEEETQPPLTPNDVPSLTMPPLNDPSRNPYTNNRSNEDPAKNDYLLTDDLLANLHWFDENFL